MMRLSSVIALLVISSRSQELEPQRLLQVRPVKKNHDFGVMMMMLITMMTMKTKESQPPERRSKQLWRQPRLLCKTNINDDQKGHHFVIIPMMIKSAAICHNVNDHQKCRNFTTISM